MDLQTIKWAILNCKSCDFRSSIPDLSKPTPPIGGQAKIMVVLLKPSKTAHEIDNLLDIKEQTLLLKILKESNISLKDVYITSLLKCAGELTPAKKFKSCTETCTSLFFLKELELVNPEIVICMGKRVAEIVTKLNSGKKIIESSSLSEIYNKGKSTLSDTIDLFESVKDA